VRRFVLISMHGASASNPLEVPRAKFAAEKVLEATDIDWLILRPTRDRSLRGSDQTNAAGQALRMVGWAARPLRPDVARLARSAVGMDTLAMAADRGDARAQLPDVPFTTIGEVIRGLARTSARDAGATD
jgi:hypothetical protein